MYDVPNLLHHFLNLSFNNHLDWHFFYNSLRRRFHYFLYDNFNGNLYDDRFGGYFHDSLYENFDRDLFNDGLCR